MKRNYFLITLSYFFFMAVLVSFLGLQCSTLAWAEGKDYPNKTIKVMVPYEPGGIVDLSVRMMMDYLAKELKVPLIIENKSGASGMLGPAMVLKASPDGYYILACADAPMVSGPLQSPNPPYDPFKDFLPVGSFGVAPTAYAVSAASPFKTIADLVKFARENPGKLTCGVTTLGGSNHLSFEKFRKDAAINIKIVPFKGTGEVISALLGRHIDMLLLTHVGLLPYTKSGEARVLAVSDAVPDSDLPTLADAGFEQDTMATSNGFFVSAKTPKPIYDKLVSTLERVAKNPELVKKWKGIGITPIYRNPAAYSKLLHEKWQIAAKLINELGLKKN